MLGYQLTFFTQQNRNHKGRPLARWLLEEAIKIGIDGATLTPAFEGYGRERKLCSARLFDLTEQPLQVTMALSETDGDRIFNRLKEEKINIFYIKTPIEFGMTQKF